MMSYTDIGVGHSPLVKICMNEPLVPAQKGFTQCDLPASEPANVHTAHPGKYSVNFQYIEQYLAVYPFMESCTG